MVWSRCWLALDIFRTADMPPLAVPIALLSIVELCFSFRPHFRMAGVRRSIQDLQLTSRRVRIISFSSLFLGRYVCYPDPSLSTLQSYMAWKDHGMFRSSWWWTLSYPANSQYNSNGKGMRPLFQEIASRCVSNSLSLKRSIKQVPIRTGSVNAQQGGNDAYCSWHC